MVLNNILRQDVGEGGWRQPSRDLSALLAFAGGVSRLTRDPPSRARHSVTGSREPPNGYLPSPTPPAKLFMSTRSQPVDTFGRPDPSISPPSQSRHTQYNPRPPPRDRCFRTHTSNPDPSFLSTIGKGKQNTVNAWYFTCAITS